MRAVSHVLYLCLYAEVLTHLLTVEQVWGCFCWLLMASGGF